MNFTVDESFLLECLGHDNPNSRITIKTYCTTESIRQSRTHCTSGLHRVMVEYECDGRSLQERLLVKVPFLNEHYDTFKKLGLYDRERHMYERVLPAMAALSGLSVSPKHFYTTASGVLVLRNMCIPGYFRDCQPLFRRQQCVRILDVLAAFHGSSARLRREDAAILTAATSDANTYHPRMTDDLTLKTYPILVRALRRVGVDARTVRNFAAYERRMRGADLSRIRERGDGRFEALNHGNLRTNNILVKNDDGAGRPATVTFFDYQMCHWNSPVFDLLFFAMTSMNFAVYRTHRDELIDGYLAALNDTLATLGCDCAYSRDDFDADVRGSKPFQVMTLILVGFYTIQMIVDNGDEHEDDIEALCKSKPFLLWFLQWFRHFDERGYFDS